MQVNIKKGMTGRLAALKTGSGAMLCARLLVCAAFLLAAAVLPRAASAAESSMKFNYQGNLRQAGFLVNGNRNMIFHLYGSSVAITPLWTSAANNVSISTGVFRVTLEPDAEVWNHSSLWLELEVEGTRLAPREEITAAPYSVNAVMLSGKKYTTAAVVPVSASIGDLWMDTALAQLKYWDGTQWTTGSGQGLPGIHAYTHAGGGDDPIISLGSHTVTGNITFAPGAGLMPASGVSAITVGTGLNVANNLTVGGILNPGSNLAVGGSGYGVSFSSSITVNDYAVFLSTVQMENGNLKYGNAVAGKVLKSKGNGFVYWGNDNNIPFSGDPFRLQMASADGNDLVASLFQQSPGETGMTLIQGSSLTVTGDFRAAGAGYIGGDLGVAAAASVGTSLSVGTNANITKDLYVAGNSQLGSATDKVHSINMANEAGVALAVDSSGASGAYTAKFYSGGTLAAWIKRK